MTSAAATGAATAPAAAPSAGGAPATLGALGTTALHFAVYEDHPPIVRLLLEARASTSLRGTGRDKTPVELAEHMDAECLPMVRLLDLADALRGKLSFQELLFPDGSMDLMRPAYEDSALCAFYNRCVVAAVRAFLERLLRRLNP